MRVYPEKLQAQLKQQLLLVYLVSGDEPLLVQECCDLVRQAARDAGCNDCEVIDVGVLGFSWIIGFGCVFVVLEFVCCVELY